MTCVALLATVETKPKETSFLKDALRAEGLDVRIIDLSLYSGSSVLDGASKLARMDDAGKRAIRELAALNNDLVGVIAIGGGTGGNIALTALKAMPLGMPSILVTTLPFDPRAPLADSAITIIPTLVDIAGLNGSLRQCLRRSAAMLAAMTRVPIEPPHSSIAITALGITQVGVDALLHEIAIAGREATVFHSNGYGGSALARFAQDQGFEGVIDFTPHELTRTEIAGTHGDLSARFSSTSALPRVILPGGLNFLGLGALNELSVELRSRPHYQHSPMFTHVQLVPDEMRQIAETLAFNLNLSSGVTQVLLPMGGFSSEDRSDGAIESIELREITAEILESNAAHYSTQRIPHHINAPETAKAAFSALEPHLT
jgi:uncharacterized protein (UPF0261 family)